MLKLVYILKYFKSNKMSNHLTLANYKCYIFFNFNYSLFWFSALSETCENGKYSKGVQFAYDNHNLPL